MELELLGSSRVTAANQITLPKEVRKALDIRAGKIIGFYKDKDGNVLIK